MSIYIFCDDTYHITIRKIFLLKHKYTTWLVIPHFIYNLVVFSRMRKRRFHSCAAYPILNYHHAPSMSIRSKTIGACTFFVSSCATVPPPLTKYFFPFEGSGVAVVFLCSVRCYTRCLSVACPVSVPFACALRPVLNSQPHCITAEQSPSFKWPHTLVFTDLRQVVDLYNRL